MPSSCQEILKAFLAVNGHRDWEMIQLNVLGAFPYGDLGEEIYLNQPKGFIDPIHPDHVWRLNSSLYGLKQSARQWNQCLSEQLLSIGFKAAQVNLSMIMLHRDNKLVATIIVHVDDILLSGIASEIKNVENILQDKFQLTQNKYVSHFLSFDISRDCEAKTFTMNQSSYIYDLVEQYNLEYALSVATPCDNHFKILSKN